MTYFLVSTLSRAIIREDLEEYLLIILAVAQSVGVDQDLVPLNTSSTLWHALSLEDWLILAVTSESGYGQEEVAACAKLGGAGEGGLHLTIVRCFFFTHDLDLAIVFPSMVLDRKLHLLVHRGTQLSQLELYIPDQLLRSQVLHI